MSAGKIKIVHIINSFEFGGAEAMLCNLLLRTDRDRFDASVVTLIDDMTVAGPIIQAGFDIVTMGMKPGIPNPLAVLKLAKYLRKLRPDVVQTWMDHSNLVGGVAARLASVPHIVWGVHHAAHVPHLTKRTTLLTVKACARLSNRVPSQIVCCSQQSCKLYAAEGFAAQKLHFIPNGFDTSVFKPDLQARESLRREIGISSDAPTIGLIARYDPLKDHANFLQAAARVVQRIPDARFVLCGANVERNNADLVGMIRSLGLNEHCRLLGPRRDMPRVYAAMDVVASSSVSEAFPLILGEAMASGVPCVATDVGDSALIVGTAGKIVPPRDSAALGCAFGEMLEMSADARRKLGERARNRVRELFDLGAVSRRYEQLYESLVANHPIAVPDVAAPKRVMMIVESSAGGTGRHVLDLAEGLIQRGSEVHLIHSTQRIDRIFTDRLAQLPRLRRLGLPIKTNIHPSDLSIAREIRRYIIERGPFDVVHGHSSKGGALARLAALGTGASAFYTLHGLIMMDPGLARWKRMMYLGIELLLSRWTAKIIAVSPEETRAAVALKLGKSRVTTIPNGLGPLGLKPRDQARRDIGLANDAIAIGFVGRLVDQKAPHVLIEAFARATAVSPQARLVMVGSGPLEAPMRELATKLGVNDRILWLGERDARGVLAAMDVFAISSRKEGLPYVVLEALGAGLPVVATASSGVEILIESGINGEVVRRDDIEGFAQALIKIVTNSNLRAQYGTAALRHAENFTVDAMVQRTIAAYASAAAAKPVADTKLIHQPMIIAADLRMEAQLQ